MSAVVRLERGSPLSLAALYSAIPSLPRDAIEGLADFVIELLDKADGDNDLEANGDELDSNGAEDDFCDHNAPGLPAPGCPLSDPGEDEGDLEEDQTYLLPGADYGADQRVILAASPFGPIPVFKHD